MEANKNVVLAIKSTAINHIHITIALCIFILFTPHISRAQNDSPSVNIPALFKAINSQPTSYYFKNKAFKIPVGGHLQGIQPYGEHSVVLTASSATVAYYIVADYGSRNAKASILQLQVLASKPYKHAGGCQLIDSTLYVGIEDNTAKDKSKVIAVRINYLDTVINSKIVLDRKGTIKRNTAGAVAATTLPNGNRLIAVGDWDTKHIDFYIEPNTLDSNAYFMATATGNFGAYQNINLLSNKQGILYLIGFCRYKNQNRADLFQLDKYVLIPVSTAYFKSKNNCSFRYASGITFTATNSLAIYTCNRNIKRCNVVNMYY